MTSEQLLSMSIKVLYLPKNFYTPKQISGYAPDNNNVRSCWGPVAGYIKTQANFLLDVFDARCTVTTTAQQQ